MKLICQINTYFSEDYLYYTLKSIYDYADRIVIIDGSFCSKKIKPRVSKDKTHEIINSFPDPDRKIILDIGSAKNQAKQRSKIFKYTEGADWVWITDDDEIYKPEDLVNLRKFLEVTQENCFRIWGYTFVNSFDWFYLTNNMRVWRIIDSKKMKYIGSNNVQYIKNKNLFDKNTAKSIPDVKRYHYSYVRDIDRLDIKQKQIYGKMLYSIKDGFYFRKGLKIKKFNGEHPEIMNNHPYRKIEWNPDKEWFE